MPLGQNYLNCCGNIQIEERFKMDILKLAELITDEPKEVETPQYIVNAYLEKSMRGLIDCIQTDDIAEVDNFIWENCQQGLYCRMIDNTTGKQKDYDPDNFNENAISVEDLIKN